MTINDILNNYDKLSSDQKMVAHKQIIKEYPFMKQFDGKGHKLNSSWLGAIPIGWRISFFKDFLDELKTELIKYNFLYKYAVLDVKEKFGAFRWYDYGHPSDSRIDEIIKKYANLSDKTCIICGKSGKITTVYEQFLPLCKECKKHDKDIKKYIESKEIK